MKKIVNLLTCSLIVIASCAQNSTDSEYDGRKVTIFTTAENTDFRLTPTGDLLFAPFGQPTEDEPCIFIDPTHAFQTFTGIGGSLTDASAETFAKLPEDQQEKFLKAYFDEKSGIGYTVARTNIHSCDFSSESYTYVSEGDKALKSFSIARDQQFRIPFIKRTIEAAGGKLNLIVSPWSPPAWMKDNNNMLRGGKLLPEYYDTWADYFVKFINAYEKEGIPVWGLTIQNEPMATQTWESCIYTADEERDFIKNHLGPKLWANGMKSKKLIAWDHNRDLLYHRASTILNDSETSQYVWGIGFHWYESWTGAPTPDNVKLVAEAFPQTHLLLTEACNYPFSWETFDEWHWGEKYGIAMITDFNNGAIAWVDWNILLDETGGPNHVGNLCFAPIHADTRTGELIYTPSYYYIGHFSKFIRPNAKRVSTVSSRSHLLSTSFLNENGEMVTIVMNQSDLEINYKLYVGQMAVDQISLPHSIQTLIY